MMMNKISLVLCQYVGRIVIFLNDYKALAIQFSVQKTPGVEK